MTKHIIKLSERTINYMHEFNDHCPTKYIIEDVAKYLNVECDWFTTSLKDLGVEKAYFDYYAKTLELYFKEDK